MKIFNRCSLPKEIKYNKGFYYCLGSFESALKEHQPGGRYKFVAVDVLARNLKGREDLHGRPYKPQRFLYGSPIALAALNGANARNDQ